MAKRQPRESPPSSSGVLQEESSESENERNELISLQRCTYSNRQVVPSGSEETAKDDDDDSTSKYRKNESKRIRGVFLCAAAVALTLLAHLTLLVIYAKKSLARGYGWSSSWSITQDGRCDEINKTATGLHVLVNIIVLTLIATSSYCCQVLAAPSRETIDRIHSQRVWISIGASSFSNIWYAPFWRKTMWILIFGTSLPVQMVYNSFLYVSYTANDFGIVIAPSELASPNANLTDFEVYSTWLKNDVGINITRLHADIISGEFEQMSLVSCTIVSWSEKVKITRNLHPLNPLFMTVHGSQHCPERESFVQGPFRLHNPEKSSLVVIAAFSVIAYDLTSLGDGTELNTEGMGSIRRTMTSWYHTKFYPSESIRFIAIILAVNTPQALISIMYAIFNNVLTRMLLAAEYNDYGVQRKPLRVSFPTGEQRSTYFLSVPYRYSVPFLVISAVAHWLASEALSYIRIIPRDVKGQLTIERSLHGVGVSSIGLIIMVVPWIVTVIAIITLMLRKFKSASMPIAGNCSAVISAACHPPENDVDAYKKCVKWGETNIEVPSVDRFHVLGVPEVVTRYRRCTFTSAEVKEPSPDFLYY
ncbi:hypothetical protein PENSTE_c046G09042 [Penicillium steckii]|uniref:DUF6536 domain-containing protein n=1 Tax=Penicillium steckii TaxID=303698 RepID=A0A1V6SJ21_9EURO|nr:hypothetical protein PENSTE_c046G09042 [Penicillium steckii]